MHDIRWIRENPDQFDKALARRGLAPLAARAIEIDMRTGRSRLNCRSCRNVVTMHRNILVFSRVGAGMRLS